MEIKKTTQNTKKMINPKETIVNGILKDLAAMKIKLQAVEKEKKDIITFYKSRNIFQRIFNKNYKK